MATLAVASLVLYLLIFLFKQGIGYLNYTYMKAHGHEIPAEFAGKIDPETLNRTMDYSTEKKRLAVFSSIFSATLFLVFLFGGVLNYWNNLTISWQLPFIWQGVFFFMLLSVASWVIELPFDYYSTFKIEQKFDFNTQTVGFWVKDNLKSLLLNLIMQLIISVVIFWLISVAPDNWWFWVWSFLFVFSMFLMVISPYVLEPLFNKYELLKDKELEGKIKETLAKLKMNISRVFQVDASRRSNHTNAYFTGIGRTKRIVLYDTLIANNSHEEIVAVLAHEAGHWKKGHLLKRIVSMQLTMFIGMLLLNWLLQQDWMYQAFRIEQPTIFTGFIIAGFLGSLISFFWTPISAMMSRRNERQADEIACELIGSGTALSSALIRLAADNLSNLHPHPLYAKLFYSHPPIIERLKFINSITQKK